jgi:hypothetical protein
MNGLEPSTFCMANAGDRSLPFALVRSNRLFAAVSMQASEQTEPERTPTLPSLPRSRAPNRTRRASLRPAHHPLEEPRERRAKTRRGRAAVGLALWFAARWTSRHELLAAGGAADHPSNQSAPAERERREHVPALVAAHVGRWGGPVVRVALGEAPDLRHPTSFEADPTPRRVIGTPASLAGCTNRCGRRLTALSASSIRRRSRTVSAFLEATASARVDKAFPPTRRPSQR